MRRLLVLVAAFLLLGATPALAATPLGGGSRLTSTSGACTAGFAATSAAGGWYLIASPGCSGTVSSGGVLVGSVVGTSSGASVVHVTNTTSWTLVGWVGGATPFNGSSQAPVGASVCLIGVGTGVHCGTIQARNQTVNFPGGVITGLTRTNVCADPGSPAVTFVSSSKAQGVLVGGSGNCTSGGTTYFAPLPPILSAYGLALKV